MGVVNFSSEIDIDLILKKLSQSFHGIVNLWCSRCFENCYKHDKCDCQLINHPQYSNSIIFCPFFIQTTSPWPTHFTRLILNISFLFFSNNIGLPFQYFWSSFHTYCAQIYWHIHTTYRCYRDAYLHKSFFFSFFRLCVFSNPLVTVMSIIKIWISPIFILPIPIVWYHIAKFIRTKRPPRETE